jgi:hypothetical protein
MKNPFVQLAEDGLFFLKRPIYVTLLYYGVALILWGIIAKDYFSQKEGEGPFITTKIGFWVLSILIAAGFLKLGIELMIPKYRRQYFRKTKPRDRRRAESHNP